MALINSEEQVEYFKPVFSLEWPEYIVFAAVLLSSLGIGIFFGFWGKRNATNEEFLMAGRSMGIVPVTLSLVCSFISAIALLGYPMEVYYYGVQFVMVVFAFPLMVIILCYLYVPVYTRLKLTSAFEYFELRFSRRVRVLCSILSSLYLILYMPITVYAPSLALDQVAGINVYLTSGSIFIVCIIYSSLGGLKAVLWTDALQAAVMIASLLAIIIAGTAEAGGFSVILQRSSESQRLEFFNTDFDPRVRHTLWTGIFGGLCFWLPVFGANQSQIQRYNSVPNLKTARITLVLTMVGLIVIVSMTSWIGLILYSYYHDCDPVGANIVSSQDQLVPLFVMEVLGKYTGIPGLLVGGLTCGTLSTVSSALNSLSAMIIEDFVKFYKPNLSEEKLTLGSKIVSLTSGIISFLLVFLVAVLNDYMPVVPLASIITLTVATIFGGFTLGMFYPWANEMGVLLAMVLSVVLCAYQAIGSVLAGGVPGKLPDQKFYLTTEGCQLLNDTEGIHHLLSFVLRSNDIEMFDPYAWKDNTYSFNTSFWSLSYLYTPGLGIACTIIFGIIFSSIINFCSKKDKILIERRLLSTPILKLWEKLFGNEYLSNWIEPKPLFSKSSNGSMIHQIKTTQETVSN